jgi:hypothetical protein
MNVVLDIVGSTVVAGLILLLVFQLNRSMGNMSFQNTLDVVTQENAKTIADMVNYDFYKIGYHDDITSANPIVEIADSNRIKFRADIDNNGAVDTVQYYTSTSPYYVHGSSTGFKQLYRTVNNTGGYGASLGITSFKLTYYDTLGILLNFPTPSDTALRRRIQSIKIQMTVKNPIASDTTLAATFDTTFAATYWEKWISPKNLRALK